MSRKSALTCGTLAAALLSSAIASAEPRETPEPRRLGAEIRALQPGDDLLTPFPDTRSLQPLGLCKVLQLALAHDPSLAIKASEIRAQRGRVVQSGLFPNPEIEVEVENFAGTDERRGLQGAEATLQLRQLVELGEKRIKRRNVAEAEKAVTGWEYEAQRLETYAEAAGSFYSVAGAEARAALRERQLDLARAVTEIVRERVSAGRAAPLEQTRANVEVSSARIALEQAQAELNAGRAALASIWGGGAHLIGAIDADLEAMVTPPSLSAIFTWLKENPDLEGAEAASTVREQQLRLERARQIPDITVSAGVRRYFDADDSALVAGISIPIPLFGLNPGGVLEASERVTQGRLSYRDIDLRLKQQAQELLGVMRTSYQAAITLREEILPAATTAFSAAQSSYSEGRLGLLDVFDAQRTLFDTRARYLDLLAAYHASRIGIERLTGRSIKHSPCGQE